MTFYGFARADGSVGTRNYVCIISSVVCANEVVLRIAEQVSGAVPFTHSQGCGHTGQDLDLVTRTLANLGKNPNVGGVLIVSLGCEGVDVKYIQELISQTEKPVELINIQEEGGLSRALSKGTEIAEKLVNKVNFLKRQKFEVNKLCVGLKCGASDGTNGLISNPLVGYVSDMLVEKGATVLISETTEFIGAENIIAERIKDNNTRNKFLSAVTAIEKRVLKSGTDMRNTQPSPGNIAGGITTIEEKSIGAIAKAGNTPICEVIDYGCCYQSSGVVMIDSHAREPELLTALAAGGAQVIIFTTGRGAPQGFPLVPVVKITGNKQLYYRMNEHIDICIDASSMFRAKSSAQQILNSILKIASGQLTSAERIGYTSGDIGVRGSII